MTSIKCVEIDIPETVTTRTARETMVKVQAAMGNGITNIRLVMAGTAGITSAGFIGFLTIAARHLEKKGGGLAISGANSQVKTLLSISRLERLVCDAEGTGA